MRPELKLLLSLPADGAAALAGKQEPDPPLLAAPSSLAALSERDTRSLARPHPETRLHRASSRSESAPPLVVDVVRQLTDDLNRGNQELIRRLKGA